MKTTEQNQIWTAHLDRNFSYITAPHLSDGGILPPIVARELSEDVCAEIVRHHNEHAALCAVADAAGMFEPYAYADDLAPNGKAHAFERMQKAIAALAAIRGGAK